MTRLETAVLVVHSTILIVIAWYFGYLRGTGLQSRQRKKNFREWLRKQPRAHR